MKNILNQILIRKLEMTLLLKVTINSQVLCLITLNPKYYIVHKMLKHKLYLKYTQQKALASSKSFRRANAYY